MNRWMPLSLWLDHRLVLAARLLRSWLIAPLYHWLIKVETRGLRRVQHDHDKARQRLAICDKCPVFNRGFCDKRRGGCGCFMETKARLANSRCPQGRW